MEKLKKYRILPVVFLIITSALLLDYYGNENEVNALSNEGTTNINAGGLSTYTCWFDDFSGLLIISTTFANESGIEFADITVIAVCIIPDRTFRLRIWDSDHNGYVNSDQEAGVGAYERRFSVMIHMDTEELTWIASVTSPNGLTTYAQILIHYSYDPNAEYTPVDENRELLDPDDVAKTILGIKVNMFVGSMLNSAAGIVLAIFYLRRTK